MCGIFGFISLSRELTDFTTVEQLRSAGKRQTHRGPDEWGELVRTNLFLGHNRLAIQDIQGSQQPMTSYDQHYTILFNGEIYNHNSLRQELISEGVNFNSQTSDTEVLINGIALHGYSFLQKLDGMYSIALYDNWSHELILIRDPSGIKPLYYFSNNNYIIFASEVKTILATGLVSIEIDPLSVAQVFLYRGPINSSIYQNILKVKPSHILAFSNKSTKALAFSTNQTHPHIKLAKQNQLELELVNSVKLQCSSESPSGVFLSGGVDSSLIASFSQFSSSRSNYAMTLDNNSSTSEMKFAQNVASQLDIDLHITKIDDQHFKKIIFKWMKHNDDALSDPSAIPLYLMSENVRRDDFRVMLSGEGADELFLGYSKYKMYILASFVKKWRLTILFNFLPLNKRFQDVISSDKDNIFYLGSSHTIPLSLLKNILTAPYFDLLIRNIPKIPVGSPYQVLGRVRELELRYRLPNDLLPRTDMATMLASIEARVPYLAENVKHVAKKIPFKDLIGISGFQSKLSLKKILCKYIDKSLVFRKKTGFEVPLLYWIENYLQTEISYFLRERRHVNLFNYDFITQLNSIILNPNAMKSSYSPNQCAYCIWSWLGIEFSHYYWNQIHTSNSYDS